MTSNTEDVKVEAPVGPAPMIFQFPAGIPGYESSRVYHLFKLGPEFGPYMALRCVDEEGGPTFVLVHANDSIGEYIIEIDDEHQEKLGLENPEDALVMMICTLGRRSSAPTCNSYAPIVFNVANKLAYQVPQPGSEFELKVQLKEVFFDANRVQAQSIQA